MGGWWQSSPTQRVGGPKEMSEVGMDMSQCDNDNDREPPPPPRRQRVLLFDEDLSDFEIEPGHPPRAGDAGEEGGPDAPLFLVGELLSSVDNARETRAAHFDLLEPALSSLVQALVLDPSGPTTLPAFVNGVLESIDAGTAGSIEVAQGPACMSIFNSVMSRFLSMCLDVMSAAREDGSGLVGEEDCDAIERLIRLVKGRLGLLNRLFEAMCALSMQPSIAFADSGITSDDLCFDGAGDSTAAANEVSLGDGGGDETPKRTADAKLHYCLQTLERKLTSMKARKLEGKLFFPRYVEIKNQDGTTKMINTLCWQGKGEQGNPEDVNEFVVNTYYHSVFSGNVIQEANLSIVSNRERVCAVFRELYNHAMLPGIGGLIPKAPLPGIGLFRPLLYCFSFQDGVLLARDHTLKHLSYTEAERLGLQSCKFFNTTLADKLEKIHRDGYLETPCLDQILSAQKLSEHRRRNLLAMLIARPLFPPKSYESGLGDSWDCFVCLKGAGGVGKSTLVSCLEEIVGSDNVAVLEGKTSEGHQLHELLVPGTQRFYPVAIASDVDQPSWSQEVIQKLASGERISINPKGRDAVVGLGPKLIVVTNGSLRMSDSGGQISRRLFCELFPFRLEERGVRPNVSFQRRISSPQEGGELANILIKSLHYYFEMVKWAGKERDQNQYFNHQGLTEVYARNSIAMIGSSSIDKRGEERGLRYLTDFFDALLEGRSVRPNDTDFFASHELRMSLGKRPNPSMPKSMLLRLVCEYIAMRSQKTYLLEELSHSELNQQLSIYRIKVGEKRMFTYVTETGYEAYLEDFAMEGISLYYRGKDIFACETSAAPSPSNSPALSPLSLTPAVMQPPAASPGVSDSDLFQRLVLVVIREDEPPQSFTISQDCWFSTNAADFCKTFKAAPLLSPVGGSFHAEFKRHYTANEIFDNDPDVVDDIGIRAIVKIIS